MEKPCINKVIASHLISSHLISSHLILSYCFACTNRGTFDVGTSFPFRSDFSPCQSSPCVNGGTCNVDSDGYSCDCLPFHSGRHCEG